MLNENGDEPETLLILNNLKKNEIPTTNYYRISEEKISQRKFRLIKATPKPCLR
jgi:hypothetical protein